MRVYKFLSAKWAKEAIVKKRLKISLFTTLNDPFDTAGVLFKSDTQRLAYSRTLSSLSQRRGLICFSEEWTNPVLWSHYADQHKGIVLGFDTSVEALRIQYATDFVTFPNDFSTSDEGIKEDFLMKAFSVKFRDWQYEREVRLFVGLDEADVNSGNFFFEFGDTLSLREIIFGARYLNPEDEAHILACARRMQNVDCIKSILGEKRFNVERDKTWKFLRD